MGIDKSRLLEKIGTLSLARKEEIIDNVIWVLGETHKRNMAG